MWSESEQVKKDWMRYKEGSTMEEKKLGLGNVISVSMGLVVATSCLVSLAGGASSIGVTFIIAMVIACLLNMTTLASLSELNALMPNVTGGLAQYSLAGVGPFPTMIFIIGGNMVISIVSSGVEASIFAYAVGSILDLGIPNYWYSIIVSLILMFMNLFGLDIFAKVQDFTAYLLIAAMLFLGLVGAFRIGTGEIITQPWVIGGDFTSVAGMIASGFWLFIGAEYAIPLSKNVKNARRNVPLGMMLGMFIICIVQSIMVIGFHNYVSWDELAVSAAPHMLYGANLLGEPGKWLIVVVATMALISTQNSTIHGMAEVFHGMSKMNMLPRCFAIENKRKAPAFGIVFLTIGIIIFAILSNDSSEAMDFWISVCSVFAMLSYLFSHINVLIFRKRMPKAPRGFKVPFIIPFIGIVGIGYMVYTSYKVFLYTLIVFVILAVYAIFWIKFKMKMPIFKAVPIEQVMAMEDDRYYHVRKACGIW